MILANTAYLGLGTNQGDKIQNIKSALFELGNNPRIKIKAISGLYSTEPIGLDESNPEKFLNAVCRIKTSLTAERLLKICQGVEKRLGRQRAEDLVMSRAIDLDLLYFNDLICKAELLELPHPEATKRDFVMIPLGDVVEENWLEPKSGLSYSQIMQNWQGIQSNVKLLVKPEQIL